MTIKTILAPISGGPASKAVATLACELAIRFRAHLEALHVLDPGGSAHLAAGQASPASPLDLTQWPKLIRHAAVESRKAYGDALAVHRLPTGNVPAFGGHEPSAVWHEEVGNTPIVVARRARFHDLVVLGRSARVNGEPYTDTIEETLLRSGRPVLIAPVEAAPSSRYVVTVAWNGSPEAVRALATAMPFIEAADAAWLLTVGDAEGIDQALTYLEWHGVRAQHEHIAHASDRHTGRVLLDHAAELGAGLMAMGGYGRSPLRELMFGGATRDAIGTTSVPVLLMH